MHSIYRRLHEIRQVSLSFHPPVFTGSYAWARLDSEARHIPPFPPFPTSRRHYFIGAANASACVKSPAFIAFLTARVPFSHSKADLPPPFRQMHMPTATLPSSGEQSNPLLRKWLTQTLASILYFQWIKKGKKRNDLTNDFRSSCSNLAECIW